MVKQLTYIALALAVFFTASAPAQTIPLSPPGEREFILDLAELISPEEEERIKATCEALLNETAIPIVVVTISSMANLGFPDWRIETFATVLFDQWGIGHANLNDQSWNRGILLLVSRDDRKARIELGADWGREQDVTSQQIMDGVIIPEFKAGDFSAGIAAGVESLDKLARGIEIPDLGFNAARAQGGAGAGGGPVGAIGGCLAGLGQLIMMPFLLIAALFSKLFGGGGGRGGGGGGGFSGGSFGGGFSGGGGATGSW